MPSELARAVAKVRADIRAAVRAKALPPHPEGITFRVRSDTASMMTAIRVDVCGVPLAWAAPRDQDQVRHYSPAWRELEAALLGMVARHYRADGRNSFATVSIDNETQTGGD